MDSVILRNYRPGDASALSRLFRTVYGEHYANHHVYLPCMFNQNHAEQRWHSLLAVEGEKIIGHATLSRGEGSCSAELALSVVHPDTRGQNIATRLGQQLLVHAQALGCRGVIIKQVTQHPYTQRMAARLGFHNCGLLADYAPSPFGDTAPESLVIGYRPIDGYRRPLPLVNWPPACTELKQHLVSVFGVRDRQVRWTRPAVQLDQQWGRHDVVLRQLDHGLLRQLRRLPAHWRICLKLRLSADLATDASRLAAAGFTFTGLAPDDRGAGWLALFHRGTQPRALQLHCPHMQRLHDALPAPVADSA